MTTFCILLVDVLGNFYHCYCIAKLHRKVGFDNLQLKTRREEQEKEVKILALSEVLEILVPLSYTISFIVAYYGPNATILRSIKNNYWGNTISGDIGAVLNTEALLFSADFSSLVVSIICLRYFCRINLLKQFCLALKKYWYLIATIAGALISKVRFNFYKINYLHHYMNYHSVKTPKIISIHFIFQYYSFKLVNYAFDTTFQFDWIYNNSGVSNNTWLGCEDFTTITNFNATNDSSIINCS